MQLSASSIGVLLALGALVSWAVGDYLIQKTARIVGDVKTLFYQGVVGAVALTPFVWPELPGVFRDRSVLLLLGAAAAVTILGSLLLFEALKKGKFAVIEPISGLELPFTVLFALVLADERLGVLQGAMIVVTFVAIVLAMTRELHHLKYHRRLFEKGVLFALAAALVMGVTNFSTAVASQQVSPLVCIWAIGVGITVFCGVWILVQGERTTMRGDLRRHGHLILAQCIIDNLAWVSFAFAVTYIPIAIATTISESYIALGVLLGVVLNREKLKPHQWAGVGLAVVSILVLALVSG